MKHKKRLTIEINQEEIQLIKEFKIKCLKRDKDMRGILLELIKDYIEERD